MVVVALVSNRRETPDKTSHWRPSKVLVHRKRLLHLCLVAHCSEPIFQSFDCISTVEAFSHGGRLSVRKEVGFIEPQKNNEKVITAFDGAPARRPVSRRKGFLLVTLENAWIILRMS